MTSRPSLEGLDDLIGRVKLAEATDLARLGRYEEARATLSSCPPWPEALDLLARIGAQQGQFAEAEELWRRAGDIVGEGEVFERQLARTRRERVSRRSSQLLGLASRLAVLGALMPGLFLAGLAVGRRDSDTGLRTLRSSLQAALKDQGDARAATDAQLVERLRQLETAADARFRPSTLDGLADKMRVVQGAEVTRLADRLLIRFIQPVFSEGTALSSTGEEVLAALVVTLGTDGSRLLAVVTGHTDGIPVVRSAMVADNAALGMARGRVGVERLRARGLPADALAVGLTTGPPFPDDDPASRHRNRTLTIELFDRPQRG